MEENTFVRPERLPGQQTTATLLMIRPLHFGSNPETAVDNAFQLEAPEGEAESIAERARKEFDVFVAKLRDVGVEVLVIEDTDEPVKTDAVFPNNWITTHADGLIITYPMFSPVRREERRRDIVERLAEKFKGTRLVTLEAWEEVSNKMLEGTGSMILDRVNRIVYAGLSQRTDQRSVEEWAEMMRFRPLTFLAVDATGIPIYHTNVMMALGEAQAVVCVDAIYRAEERKRVVDTLTATGKQIIPITLEQMAAFAGNMLEVRGAESRYWVMSTSAYDSLTEEQRSALKSQGSEILHSRLTTIEAYGGGSARCMMAEIFLEDRE